MNRKLFIISFILLYYGVIFLSSGDAFGAVGDETRITVPLRSELPHAESVALTIEKAKSGDLAAQNNLGDMFLTGSGFPVDCAQAFHWFQVAAEKNFPAAQFNLGNMYLNGRGVAQNLKIAKKWYQKAAAQDFPAALNQLGVIAENDQEAIAWYQRAAVLGFAPAQNNLGVAYARGKGVAADQQTAAEWYAKAAAQGSAAAQNNLGLMYVMGRGVAKNDSQAFQCFKNSAEQGFALAQSNLAMMFKDGRGVKQDLVSAYVWLSLAMKNNVNVAGELVKNVESKLSAEEKEVAGQRMSGWLTSHYPTVSEQQVTHSGS